MISYTIGDLSELQIMQGQSVNECMEKAFSADVLSGENKLYCLKYINIYTCMTNYYIGYHYFSWKSLTDGYRQTRISQSSDVFIIHIQRYTYLFC